MLKNIFHIKRLKLCLYNYKQTNIYLRLNLEISISYVQLYNKYRPATMSRIIIKIRRWDKELAMFRS